jgi:hypothetical protein
VNGRLNRSVVAVTSGSASGRIGVISARITIAASTTARQSASRLRNSSFRNAIMS